MEANELTFSEIKLLRQIGKEPESTMDELAELSGLAEGTVPQKVNKFRSHSLVVKGVGELEDEGYRWLLTGKGVELLNDCLRYVLDELDLGFFINMERFPAAYFYRPNPAQVRRASLSPYDEIMIMETVT